MDVGRWMRRMRAPREAAALSLLMVAACAAPIRVRSMDSQGVHRTLTENVLTTGEPSVTSRIVLQRRGLADLATRRTRTAVLAKLHARLVQGIVRPAELFALAELSFHHAERAAAAPHYLASAVYAWDVSLPCRRRRASQSVRSSSPNRGGPLQRRADEGFRGRRWPEVSWPPARGRCPSARSTSPSPTSSSAGATAGWSASSPPPSCA